MMDTQRWILFVIFGVPLIRETHHVANGERSGFQFFGGKIHMFLVEPDRPEPAVNSDHLDQIVMYDSTDRSHVQNLAASQPLLDGFHSVLSPVVV